MFFLCAAVEGETEEELIDEENQLMDLPTPDPNYQPDNTETNEFVDSAQGDADSDNSRGTENAESENATDD